MPAIRRPTLLMLIAAWAAAPAAWAADEAPVATRPVSVADQIDAYLKSAPPLSVDDASVDGVILTRPDRKPHGVAEVAVGTGGYRSFYARSDMPVGKTGTLSIAVQDSRSNRGFIGPYGYASGYGGGYGGGYGHGGDYRSLGVGLALGDAARPMGGRCRRSPYGAPDELGLEAGGCRRGFGPGAYRE